MNDPAPTASDLLSQRHLSIGERQTLRDAFAILMDPGATADGEHTFVVTGEDGKYAGILSLRGFLVGLFANWNLAVKDGGGEEEMKTALHERLALEISGVMERNRPRVTPATPLAALIPLFTDPEFECLPVLDGDELLGVIYVADVFRAAAALALTPGDGGIRLEKHGE